VPEASRCRPLGSILVRSTIESRGSAAANMYLGRSVAVLLVRYIEPIGATVRSGAKAATSGWGPMCNAG
jgi:hypothetical protein